MNPDFLMGAYVFILAIFLGVVLISRVPATLHTPLMSATNAIHGIVLIGAMIVLGSVDSWWLEAIAFVAVILGAGNVVGGFVVTDRMLQMFKKRTPPTRPNAAAEQSQ
ncbi:NAD(P) transhydrogenase subunit alpha [soil metagenome]